jgi:hypothetical protein
VLLSASTITPDSRLQQLILNAVRAHILGGNSSVAEQLVGAQKAHVKFVLDTDAKIIGVQTFISCNTLNADISVRIIDDSGGATPSGGVVVVSFDQYETLDATLVLSWEAANDRFNVDAISTGAARAEFTLSTGAILLKAGLELTILNWKGLALLICVTAMELLPLATPRRT